MPLGTQDIVQWREGICRELLRLDYEAASDVPFAGSVRQIAEGCGLRLVQYSHTSGALFRDKSLLTDGQDDLSVLVPVRSKLNIGHCGRVVSVAPGQAIVLRSDKAGHVLSPERNAVLVLQLEADVARTFGGLFGLAGETLQPGKNVRLLKSYMSWVVSQQPVITSASGAVLARQMLELLRLCTDQGTSSPAGENDLAGARVELALAYIAQHFHDPELSESDVAANQGISVRYLQKLFEKSGKVFSACLSDRRLQAAHDALLSGCSGGIVDIALSVGYDDLSNFYRMFRRKFGVTPAELRRQLAKQ